ncbi:MAG: hypothetical protein Q9219_001608 [cf. Caloplaca sp. 3 TL-2023]
MHKHTDRYDPYRRPEPTSYRVLPDDYTTASYRPRTDYYTPDYDRYYLDPTPNLRGGTNYHNVRVYTVSPTPEPRKFSQSATHMHPARMTMIKQRSPSPEDWSLPDLAEATPVAPPPPNTNNPNTVPLLKRETQSIVQTDRQVVPTSTGAQPLATASSENRPKLPASMTQHEMEILLSSLNASIKAAQENGELTLWERLKNDRLRILDKVNSSIEQAKKKKAQRLTAPSLQSDTVSVRNKGPLNKAIVQRPMSQQTLPSRFDKVTNALNRIELCTKEVAELDEFFHANTRTAAMDGLGMALVAATKELVTKAEDVTGQRFQQQLHAQMACRTRQIFKVED